MDSPLRTTTVKVFYLVGDESYVAYGELRTSIRRAKEDGYVVVERDDSRTLIFLDRITRIEEVWGFMEHDQPGDMLEREDGA